MLQERKQRRWPKLASQAFSSLPERILEKVGQKSELCKGQESHRQAAQEDETRMNIRRIFEDSEA